MSPTRSELAELAYGLTTIAVTGTNGKTSTTGMIADIVRASGQVPVRVTTLGMWVGDDQTAADGSMESFARTLRRAREAGARTLALEVTSRALAEGFAARWPPHVAAFTNLTHEHLDRHGTVERYLAAKAQLFLHVQSRGTAVLNLRDPASTLLREVVPLGRRCLSYSSVGSSVSTSDELEPAALAAERIECTELGTRIELAPSEFGARLGGSLSLRVLGEFQAENALCAALAAHAAGFSAEAIRVGLSTFAGVPGRMQRCAEAPLVLVDSAHTPDALARTLETARAFAIRRCGRLLCVFGCGGERDRDKRPLMGAVASLAADAVWLTTDNARSEPAEAIAAMVRAGAIEAGARWHEQLDRRAAIEASVMSARPEDVVVIAGRGHETHLQLAGRRLPFFDPDVVRDALALREPG